jgi:Ni/Co efflux regulator RcnB
MKTCWSVTIGAAALLALGWSVAAQDRQRDDQNRGQTRGDQNQGRDSNGQNAQGHDRFDNHDQQVTRDWYNQHQDHPPAGLRSRDRLSADEESRLREGSTLDRNLRRKVHPAPADLSRQLPPPARNQRYVTLGGHVGLIDNSYQVHDVIHLHDNR